MNYTIKFNFNTKDLITTNKIPILIHENLADKMLFYIEEKYLETDLSSYVCMLKYTTVDEEIKYEVLPLCTDESVQKEGYLAYTFNIDSELTENVGYIYYYIILSKMSPENNDIQYVICSKQNSLYISPIKETYHFSEDKTTDIERAIEALEGQVDNLQTLMAIIQDNMPKDVVISDNDIMLRTDMGAIGNGIDLEDLGNALVESNDEGLSKIVMDE